MSIGRVNEWRPDHSGQDDEVVWRLRTAHFADTANLHVYINEWLSEHPNVEIVDIKYASAFSSFGVDLEDCGALHSALVIYREKVDADA